MDQWATYSMEERVWLFKRRYPNSNITLYKLRKFYRQIMTRKKLIKEAKMTNPADFYKLMLQAVDMAQDVKMAIERKFRIVQLDECCVTKRTMPKTSWSLKNTNIKYDLKIVNTECKAILAAVSREFGVDHIQVFRHSVSTAKF